VAQRKKVAQTVEVVCAFCSGSGKDRFDLMSSLSSCQVCGGLGHRILAAPVHKCAYCSGTGVHPHSRMVCMTCRGAGQVSVPAHTAVCPGCGGTGREADHHFADSVLACSVCGGRGVVPAAQAEATAGV
jgi:DnaJ-class molecular chaperone